jgi:hypothetical protein
VRLSFASLVGSDRKHPQVECAGGGQRHAITPPFNCSAPQWAWPGCAKPDLPVITPTGTRPRALPRRAPRLEIASVARRLAFPHATQAMQITRRHKTRGKWSRETYYVI